MKNGLTPALTPRRGRIFLRLWKKPATGFARRSSKTTEGRDCSSLSPGERAGVRAGVKSFFINSILLRQPDDICARQFYFASGLNSFARRYFTGARVNGIHAERAGLVRQIQFPTAVCQKVFSRLAQNVGFLAHVRLPRPHLWNGGEQVGVGRLRQTRH